jgi:HK97 family phage portal protein
VHVGLLIRTADAVAERRAADIIEPWTNTMSTLLSRRHGESAPSTPSSSVRLAVVLTCVRIYADAVANLPFIFYRRLAGDDRDRDPGFYLSPLLGYAPNPEMSAMTFVRTLTAHVVAWGNGYAEIVRDDLGRPVELWPLLPDRMDVVRVGGRLTYRYTRMDGSQVDLRPDQVFHLPGLSFNGVLGMSILANQRAVELAQSAEVYGEAMWRNNARPGIIASHPKTLTDGAVARLQAQFEKMKGPENSNKTVIMEEGLTMTEVGIPPAEAQWIESRKFQRAEIIGMFLIPPHKAGDVERSSSWGAGIAEQNQSWLDLGLGTYLRMWEQEVQRSLIVPAYQRTHYGEFLRDALLRGDPLKRAQVQHIRWMDGNLSQNEIRRMENQNAVAGGDGYYVPLNMIPVEQAGAEQQAAAVRSWMSTPNPPAIPDPTSLIESGVAAPTEAP